MPLSSTPHRSPKRQNVGFAVLALSLVLAPGCAGVRYGLSSLFRPDTDYEALARERASVERGAAAASAPQPYWTQYRGPRGDGRYEEGPLALDWDAGGPPLLWRARVGPAYSSVVVAGGLALTMEQRDEREVVLALEYNTGRLVWEHPWEARFYEAMSKEGPRATPAVAGGAVVAIGASGELRCMELATGELRWRHSLGTEDGENLFYGLSASPRIRGRAVIAQGPRSVHAFELESGAELWSALDETLAYATPQYGDLLGRETWIATTSERIVGLEHATGNELWSIPWKVKGGLGCTQPMVIGSDRLLLSAGYGQGSRLIELTRTGDAIGTSVVWKSPRFKTRFNEPLVLGDHAFGLDEGILACIEVASGKRSWKKGRYGFGQLIAADELLLLVDEDGSLHRIAADPEKHRELGSFQALRGSQMLNLPALAHGLLYVRNEQELICYDLRPNAAPPLGIATE